MSRKIVVSGESYGSTPRSWRRVWSGGLLAGAVMLASCGKETPSQPCTVASLSVVPSTGSISVGEATQLAANLNTSNCSLAPSVTWIASGVSATVSSTGLVTGVSPGSTTITAQALGSSANAIITVTAPLPAALILTPVTSTLDAIGATVQLTGVVRDARGNTLANAPIIWASEQAGVASVNAGGLVTAIANGTATIRATSGGVQSTVTVTVLQTVSAITVTPATARLDAIGKTVAMTASPRDSRGNAVPGVNVVWESLQQSIASVSPAGVVAAVSAGTATIRANSGAVSGIATVVVAPVASNISVTPTSSMISIGQSVTLSAVVQDANGNILPGATVVWESGNPSVATVNNRGVVTAQGVGTATVTASSGSSSASAIITVQPVAAAVVITPATSQLAIGSSATLVASVRDAAGNVISGASVVWDAQPGTVASISQTGVLTALAAGTSQVTARTPNGVQGAATVTVLSPVASLAITPANPSLFTGGTLQLTATASDAAGNPLSGVTFTWSSATTTTATVGPLTGLVTAVAAGSSVITAQAPNGLTVTTIVTVTPAPASITVSPTASSIDALGKTVQLTATVRDVFSNVIPNASVVWSVDAPGQSIVTVNSTGLVTAILNGSATVRATAGTLAPVLVPITVSQVVSSLTWVTQPSAGVANVNLPAMRLALRDSRGNIATNATGSFMVSIQNNPLGGALSGTLVVAPVAGIIQYADLRLSKHGSNYMLRVSNASGSLALPSGFFLVDYDQSTFGANLTLFRLNGVGGACTHDGCLGLNVSRRVPVGTQATIEFSGKMWNQPSCVGCNTQIVFSFDGVNGVSCSSANPGVFPGNVIGLLVTVAAPAAAGTYLLRYRVVQQSSCITALSNYATAPGSVATPLGYLIAFDNSGYSVGIQSVQLNGDVPYAVVKGGATVVLRASVQVWNATACPSCIQQVVIGINNTAQDCLYNSVPGTTPGFTGTGQINLTAPSTPGTYEVRWKNDLQFNCMNALAAYNTLPPGTSRAIATIVVVP